MDAEQKMKHGGKDPKLNHEKEVEQEFCWNSLSGALRFNLLVVDLLMPGMTLCTIQ
jgi:hypothetical protein